MPTPSIGSPKAASFQAEYLGLARRGSPGSLLAILTTGGVKRVDIDFDEIALARARKEPPRATSSGFSMIEMAIVMAIIGLFAVLATPFFVTYYQASRLRVAAEEVAAFVNQGRELAIRENQGACVHIGATAVQYQLGTTCVGPAWVGPGTDAAGNIPLPQGTTLTTTADPVFSYLGASTLATITVTNVQDGHQLHVNVAVSGRVSIGP
jgi:prepilin-type N-terminal cleavage/methylation domain-containing protein